MFSSEKAGLFPILERRKIVQKLRKTSHFWAAIVDIACIPYEKPVIQNIKWDLGKSRNRVLSMPSRQIRAFSLLFLTILITFASPQTNVSCFMNNR